VRGRGSPSSSFPSTDGARITQSRCKSPAENHTKDNVSIDTAVVYHISDPKAVIVIENVYNAINQISRTTVRNVAGASACQLL
jgi:regulator of protease activity HflC (stomatin/prohibitin superfamily)